MASAVQLAVSAKRQPLDLPMHWTYGHHTVTYEEVALRQDFFIHRSATYTMVVAMKDAIEALAPALPAVVRKAEKNIDQKIRAAIQAVTRKPWRCSDNDVVVAYHIARLIRNAYSHSPLAPTWKIHPELQAKAFSIPNILTLDTTGLHGTTFDWRHYGGPLAMFRFCRFVRIEIMGDRPLPRKIVPIPKKVVEQIGDMFFTKVDEIPPGAAPIKVEKLPDGGIPLGGGYVLGGGENAKGGDL